jgi:hypothetical protein
VSRKIAYAYLGLLAATSAAAGSDVSRYPPGQNPFHAPKSPKPAGVLAETCFGYFQTRWTPWSAACTVGPCGGPCVPPVGTVVITETAPAKLPAPKVQSTPPPAPLPAPPVK